MSNSILKIILTLLLFVPLNGFSANNVVVNTNTICFEDFIDNDLNDFCGNFREINNYDNDEKITNSVITFTPTAMGADHLLSFEVAVPNGTQYIIREENGSAVTGVVNDGSPLVIYSSKADAFPNSFGTGLLNTLTTLNSNNFIKGKPKTIMLWFSPAIDKVNGELVNFSKLAQIRNNSFSPNQIYNHNSVSNGVRNMAIFPLGKPIGPEGVFFYDSMISEVPGSEADYNSSTGMKKPSECDPRVPGNEIDEGCREVIAQFLSSDDNVHIPGKNVDISQSNIPETAVPEYSPLNSNGDRLNLGQHMDQIIDLDFNYLSNKSHCDLYECPNNTPNNNSVTSGPQMILDSPNYLNSSESNIAISVNSVLEGDIVSVYSDSNCTSLIQSGTVTTNSISFSISGVADGANTYFFNVTDLNSNVGGCTEGITYTKTNLSFSGVLTYDYVPNKGYLDYNSTRQEPIRNMKIELFNASDDTLVSTSKTDDFGKYSFSVPSSGDYYWILTSSMANPNVVVVDNMNGYIEYAVQGSNRTINNNIEYSYNAPSGWGGSSYTSARVAAPFAILDSIYTTTKLINSYNSVDFSQHQLKVNWSVGNQASSSFDPPLGYIRTSSYYANQIFILGKENSDTDEYDRHVVVHEWFHYFEDYFSRSDSMGGAHGFGDIKDLTLAFGEGFATAMSGIVFYETDTSNNSINSYKYGDSSQGGGFQINMENGRTSTNINLDPYPGWYSEISVIKILFDLVDDMAETHDNISKNIGDIMDVMLGNQKTTSARTSIFSFINYLKINIPADTNDIDSLTTDNNIENVVDEFGSGEDNFHTWSMSNVYEELDIGGTDITNFYLGGRGYLYNDMVNNRYIKFTAQGTSTSLTLNASNTGHIFRLQVFKKDSLERNREFVSSNGAINEVFPTAVGETYVARIYVKPTEDASASGTFNLTISGE